MLIVSSSACCEAPLFPSRLCESPTTLPTQFYLRFLACRSSEKHNSQRKTRQKSQASIKVTSSLMDASMEQLRMGMGGVCARQDNTQERRHVIEISIKEVISGVIAEVLCFVFVCVRESECGKMANRLWNLSLLTGERRSKAATPDKNAGSVGVSGNWMH